MPNALGPESDSQLEAAEAPRFFSAQDSSTWKKPDDKTWGEWGLKPDGVLSSRQRKVAELLFEGTKTHSEIANEVGYSLVWISRLAQSPRVLREIERLKDKAFEATVGERLKDMGPYAATVVEGLLTNPKTSEKVQADVAKWVLEKLTGKARQEVDVGSSTLSEFLRLAAELKAAPPKGVGSANPGETIDVTPAPKIPDESTSPAGAGSLDFAKWVDVET